MSQYLNVSCIFRAGLVAQWLSSPSASVAQGSPVRILSGDLHTAHQAMLWQHPTQKNQKDSQLGYTTMYWGFVEGKKERKIGNSCQLRENPSLQKKKERNLLFQNQVPGGLLESRSDLINITFKFCHTSCSSGLLGLLSLETKVEGTVVPRLEFQTHISKYLHLYVPQDFRLSLSKKELSINSVYSPRLNSPNSFLIAIDVRSFNQSFIQFLSFKKHLLRTPQALCCVLTRDIKR